MRGTPRTGGAPARPDILDEPPPADCAFCRAAIRHLHHVPISRVRVGQDYGDAE